MVTACDVVNSVKTALNIDPNDSLCPCCLFVVSSHLPTPLPLPLPSAHHPPTHHLPTTHQWTQNSGSCSGMEIEFSGKKLIANEGASCPINVTISTPAYAPFTAAVKSPTVRLPTPLIVSPLSPVVYSLTPRVGTALGGDVVTLTGRGFSSGTGLQNVTLNGMPCKVLSSNDTVARCRTTRRREMLLPRVDVVVGGVGRALVNDSTTTYFSYLDKWSELTTWLNDEAPGEGDTVIVPAGQAILVDISPPRLFLVLVQGEMVFDPTVPVINFNASYIFALGGKIRIGTETEPLHNKVTITLHGDRTKSIEIPGVGAKTLGVMNLPRRYTATSQFAVAQDDPGLVQQEALLSQMQAIMGDSFGQELGAYGSYVLKNATASAVDILTSLLATSAAPNPSAPVPWADRGIIDIHGAPRLRVWTFGAQPVPRGTTTIVTKEPVDFVAGEKIFISSTSVGRLRQHEELTVISRPDAHTIEVLKPVQFDHDCSTYKSSDYGFSDTLICFEIGLLSRNVVIQGDDESEAQQFGMHSIAAMGATMRVEDAEWRRCGQSLIVGRYCMHFHILSDETLSYARANSFHDSFQRAVTIHASNGLRVTDNVAFRVMAHSFFVEDGVEMGVVLEGNLVADQLNSPGPIRSDSTAACFWTASPSNHWKNNVCSGASNGFWIQPPFEPTGPSHTDQIVPPLLPLGTFFNNTAHSCDIGMNAWIAGGYILCSMEPGQAIANSTMWRNGQGFFVGEVSSAVQFVGNK